jgi:chromosomal replication initiation ATPase DnaA
MTYRKQKPTKIEVRKKFPGASMNTIVFLAIRKVQDDKLTYHTLENILQDIADVFHINKNDIVSKSRKSPLPTYRHIYFYVARKSTGLSFKVIGHKYRFDHSTVINGVNQVSAYIDIAEPSFMQVWTYYTKHSSIMKPEYAS